MNKKDVETITKILLIGGILLCAFAQIAPWGEIKVDLVDVRHFYSWGTNVPSSSITFPTNQWWLYFSIVTNSSFLDTFTSGNYSLIPIFMSVLVFPVSLVSLIFGYLDLKYFHKKHMKVGIEAGAIAVLSVVLYYIFFQLGIISLVGITSSYYDWSIGFYMMIFSAILFFSSYFIKKRVDEDERIKK